MTVASGLLKYIVLAPLAGFLFNGLLGRRAGRGAVSLVGCFSVFASFFFTLVAGREMAAAGEPLAETVFAWIPAGGFQRSFGALGSTALGLVMVLFVTGVGFLIHVYSLGYMARATRGYAALLRLSEPLHLRDDPARAGRQPARSCSSAGRGRALLATC